MTEAGPRVAVHGGRGYRRTLDAGRDVRRWAGIVIVSDVPGQRSPSGHDGSRRSLTVSPAMTQWPSDGQLTTVTGCETATESACFQVLAPLPVSTTRPASGVVATEVPTTTQEPATGHDTSVKAAAVGGTRSGVHVDPPSVVVMITPWPVRAPSSVVAVVPTTVQSNPGTPGRVVVVVAGTVDVVVATGGPPAAGGAFAAVDDELDELDDENGRLPFDAEPEEHASPPNEPVPKGTVS